MEWDEKIRYIESELGITDNKGQLARLLGVRSGTISDIKNGKAKNPGSNIALLLINRLGVNPAWLETGSMPIFLKRLTSSPFNGKSFPPKGELVNPIYSLREIPDGGIVKDDSPSTRTGEIPLIYPGDERLQQGIIIPFLGDQAVSAGYGAELEDEDRPVRYFRVPAYLGHYPNLAILPVRGDSMDPTLHDGDMVVCDGGGWDGDGIYVIKTSDKSFVKRVVSTSKGYQVISDNQAYPSYGESKEDVTIVGKVRAAMIMMSGRRGGI